MNKTRKVILPMNDARLLAKFASDGDEAAFAHLVRKYESLVWNICCRILHNRCDAEDAFQSTFMLLATRARRIRKPKSLSSWLYGVAFRTASTIRRQRQRDMLPLEDALDCQCKEDVLHRVAQKNENELVSAEVLLMKEKLRTPILMFYFMGNSVSEIASSLNLTVSAVEGRLRQGRKTLKTNLILRGITFEHVCTALVVPCLAITPSLASTTINSVLVASTMTSMSGMLSKLTTSFSQFGAKTMITKIACTCGLFFVATVGVIHPRSFDEPSEVTLLNAPGEPTFTLPIKFADEEEVPEANPISFHVLHDFVYDGARHYWNRLINSESEEQVIVVEGFEIDESEAKNRFVARIVSGDSKENKVNSKTEQDVPTDRSTWVVEEVEFGQELEFKVGGQWEARKTFDSTNMGQKKLPVLSEIPFLGKLFKKATPLVVEGHKIPEVKEKP
ncbi:MAG: sigma-70 family RNA polymerase sigma factor [Planctomycetota bacterium]